jgi:hypothetical protein
MATNPYLQRAHTLQDQRWADDTKFKLAPLSQALQADQTRLALYADPNDPSKAVTGKEKEYEETVNRMTQTIGQMRGILGEKAGGPNPVEAGAGDLLAKLHITNHLKAHVAQVRAQDAAKYQQQNQAMAGQYAQGTPPPNPAELTPAEAHAAARIKGGLDPGAEKTPDMKPYKLPDGTKMYLDAKDPSKIPPGAVPILPGDEKAPKGLKALEQGGVAYGVEDQDTGKQYLPSQLSANGDAPPEAKQIWQTIKQAQKDKQAEEDKKEDERIQAQSRSIAAGFERMGMSQQFQENMAQYRSDLQTYRTLNTQADQSEETVAALKNQYAQPGNKSAADNELQNFYTTVVQKGGRKTAAELNLTLKIGSFGMNIQQMADKAASGELPDPLRKMLLDGMEAVSKEQRTMADQTKPELPEIAAPEGPTTKKNRDAQKKTKDPLGVL